MRYNAYQRCVKTYGFNWIATIFSTKKYRNDTVCFSGSLNNIKNYGGSKTHPTLFFSLPEPLYLFLLLCP
ncbi:MAG: hypothetical protein IKZ88_07470 [Neisseriaceae bacterium]|nr:hypothetical protein [Neisseriaceae bacterium]